MGKMCPLRKKISVIHTRPNLEERRGEDFLPCIETECAFWDKDNKICAINALSCLIYK